MVDRRRLRRAALALAGVLGAATAQAQAVRELELPSCVRGSPPLRVPVTAERATLDAADRKRFDEAAQARYPLYQRGGMVPEQVLLIRRGGQWQYVTLWPGGAGPCVTAVFAAERFSFTPAWLARYRPRAVDPGD